MVKTESQVFAIATLDGRLRVEFRRQQDRFAHRILLDQAEVARSVEGDADEPWPDSPPLQQLSLEEIKQSETILAVGSAGRSHWSLSAQIEPDREAAASLRFDVAARCRDPRNHDIRSTYLAADSILVQPCEAEAIETTNGGGNWKRVSIRPAQATGSAAVEVNRPATVCWSYRIVVVDQRIVRH